MLWTLEKTGSPGFGVSLISPLAPLLMCLSTAPGLSIQYFFNIFWASLKVELSGQVGPDAIAATSSPVTSDKISETTVHDLSTCLSSCPPLIDERCLRTTFTSWIDTPEPSSRFVILCLSCRDTPGAGIGISA